MIYYIIPPFIIIIGLAILISLIFRKMSSIPRSELSELANDDGKNKKRILASAWKGFTGLWLRILEKLVQRFKLQSLKFHNASQKWFQAIKKKREQRIESEILAAPQEKQEEKPEVIPEVSPVLERKIIKTEEIKRSPMVSKKVVLPEQATVSKDRLEEALIERIATNPQDIEAYERLGDYYIEQGNNNEALECFGHVIKLSPMHRRAKLKVRRLEKMLGK
jgi:lipoprotein NlpI